MHARLIEHALAIHRQSRGHTRQGWLTVGCALAPAKVVLVASVIQHSTRCRRACRDEATVALVAAARRVDPWVGKADAMLRRRRALQGRARVRLCKATGPGRYSAQHCMGIGSSGALHNRGRIQTQANSFPTYADRLMAGPERLDPVQRYRDLPQVANICQQLTEVIHA